MNSKNQLQSLSINNIKQLISFCVEENKLHHSNNSSFESTYELECLILEESIIYANSQYTVLKNFNNIEASIRVALWDREHLLPIHKIFNISKDQYHDYDHIWHIGRFAISRKVDSNMRISLFKKLLFNAFYPPFFLKRGIVLAECDKKLILTLNKLGIKTEILSDPQNYLGSLTFAISISTEALENFISKNNSRYLDVQNTLSVDFFISKKRKQYVADNTSLRV